LVAAKTWAALFAAREWAIKAERGLLKSPPPEIKKTWGELFQQTNDDGYVIVGYTDSFGTNDTIHDLWLLRTDFMGMELWNKTIPACSIAFPNVPMSTQGTANMVKQTADGGYIIIAGNNSCKMPPYSNLSNRTGSNIRGRETTIRLFRFYDVWLIKMDSNGNRLWDKTFGGSGNDDGNSIYIKCNFCQGSCT